MILGWTLCPPQYHRSWEGLASETIMYSYYAATSVGIRFPMIVPSFITILQLVQMIIGTTVNLTTFAHHFLAQLILLQLYPVQ